MSARPEPIREAPRCLLKIKRAGKYRRLARLQSGTALGEWRPHSIAGRSYEGGMRLELAEPRRLYITLGRLYEFRMHWRGETNLDFIAEVIAAEGNRITLRLAAMPHFRRLAPDWRRALVANIYR